jgi:hypothetical protein
VSEPRYIKRVNVSSIHDFIRCRQRWLFRWYLNRVPRATAPALEFGKLLHEVFEAHFRDGVSMEEAVARFLPQESVENAPRTMAQIDLAYWAPVLKHWKEHYPVTRTLEVEAPFELPIPGMDGMFVVGRPDRVVEIWGRIYHMQNRGLDEKKNLALYTELGMRNMHELVYAWALKQKYPEMDYGGTVYNLLRKATLQNRKREDKFKPPYTELLGQKMVPMLSPRIEHAMRKVAYFAAEMERTVGLYEAGGTIGDSDLMDGGWYGNSRDPYFDVLIGKRSIWDNRYFVNREDLYESKVKDADA